MIRSDLKLIIRNKMKKVLLTIFTLGIYALVNKNKDQKPAETVVAQPVPNDDMASQSADSGETIVAEQPAAPATDAPIETPAEVTTEAPTTETAPVSEPTPVSESPASPESEQSTPIADSGLAQPPAETAPSSAESTPVNNDTTQNPPTGVV